MTVDWKPLLANGVPKTQGPVPQRKEIRELTDIEMYLFFEGLAAFENVPNSEDLSYYQISGIHGLPYETWPQGNDEIKPRADFANRQGGFGGFCTHSSILFLPWHRPYLALFERELHKHVNAVAAKVTSPDKDKYVEAAKAFRLPFWDWAKNTPSSVFPQQGLESYKLRTPNPLAKAPFLAGTPATITTIAGTKYSTTVRYPEVGKNGEKKLLDTMQIYYDDPDDPRLAENRGNTKLPPALVRNLSERVSNILRTYTKYGPMSNNRWADPESGSRTTDAETFGSLEDIHNSLHDYIGGTGHMGNPIYSSFDPIFWLHHCNIDRLFAIWQVMNQVKGDAETWVPAAKAGDKRFTTQMGNFTVPRDGVEDKSTPLYPLRKAVSGADTWYKSDDCKWTEDFGYTYEETANLKPEEVTDEEKSKLRQRIAAQYPSPAREMLSSIKEEKTAGEFLLAQSSLIKTIETSSLPATVEEQNKIAAELPEPTKLLEDSLRPKQPLLRGLVSKDNSYLEWFVNLKAVKHALGGRYTVSVFLGPVEEQSVELWPFSPTFLGTFYPFGQDAETSCAKCQVDQAHQVQVTSQIPLTVALMERYLAKLIPDLTPEGVKPYLTQNLHWRVTVDGNVLQDRSQVDGLTVFVVSNKVTLPTDDSQEPTYDPDVTIYPEITTKAGDDNAGRGEGTGLAIGEQ